MEKLFIDIETIPAGEPCKPEDLKAPDNYTKPEAILKWQQENVDKEFRKRSVITYKSRILVIAWAIDDEPVNYVSLPYNADDSEKAMIEYFINEISSTEENRRDLQSCRIIGHNVMFDLKTIAQRCFKYGIHIPEITTLTSYSPRIADTMRMFTLGDRQDLVSLSDILKFLGIEDKSMKGADVYDNYLMGNINQIIEYCRLDVAKTRIVYNMLTV